MAEREGNPGVGRHGDGGGNAGHDLERHAGVEEGGGLLAAPGEHERVAALEPHDVLAGLAPLDKERVDVVLLHRLAAGRLADRDPLGSGRCQVEQVGNRQPVVDDDVRRCEHLRAPPGQQPGVTRTGPDQKDGHSERLRARR